MFRNLDTLFLPRFIKLFLEPRIIYICIFLLNDSVPSREPSKPGYCSGPHGFLFFLGPIGVFIGVALRSCSTSANLFRPPVTTLSHSLQLADLSAGIIHYLIN